MRDHKASFEVRGSLGVACGRSKQLALLYSRAVQAENQLGSLA
jgi:hypothetical protein